MEYEVWGSYWNIHIVERCHIYLFFSCCPALYMRTYMYVKDTIIVDRSKHDFINIFWMFTGNREGQRRSTTYKLAASLIIILRWICPVGADAVREALEDLYKEFRVFSSRNGVFLVSSRESGQLRRMLCVLYTWLMTKKGTPCILIACASLIPFATSFKGRRCLASLKHVAGDFPHLLLLVCG